MEKFWKADPHQWGPGQTHLFHEDGTKTACGKLLASIPGKPVEAAEYTCRACAQAVITRENREKSERAWQARQEQYLAGQAARERNQAARERKWWSWYQAYLQSPEWKQRRAAVLERARHVCEGCGVRLATQAHHLTYAHVGNEPLFDLRAICDYCHDRLTEDDRKRRQAAASNGRGNY